MMKLTDREWKEFRIEDIFDISGTTTTHPSKLCKSGITPRITCAATNNGLDGFYNNIPTEKGRVLTVDSATVGFVAYQEHDFIATDHVEKLILKEGELNRYIALFIKMCIDNSKEGKFGYGYKFAQRRIKRQSFLLPVTADQQPDWQFMEDYMREQEITILKPTIITLCKQLNISNLGGGKSDLSNLNWKEFVFGKEFEISATSSGIDKNKLITGTGKMPYITRTDVNNGIDGFIPEQASRYRIDEGNVITIGLDTQTVFYQPTSFYTGQNIQVIRHPQLDKYNAMFLVVAIKKLVERFSWGSYGATLTRLRKSRIYLPATENGDIDFAYMSTYMRNLENETLSHTIKYFKRKIA